MRIILSDLAEISMHEEHIKERCKFVKHVFSTSIYFKSESSPETSGLSISYHGFPFELTKTDQARMILAINAICDTDFQIEGY